MNIERQYIGARYVPILGGSWDRNKSYEALTIVQANNNSYTSKKAVPPGIDITNTEYWVVTGNFNGQVGEYRQQVGEYRQQVEQLKSEFEQLKSEFEQQVGQAESLVSFLSGKTVTIIGDSISDNTTFPPNWVQRIVNMCTEYNVSCTINRQLCINGSSFAGFAKELTLLDNVPKSDIIIIELGINDYQGQYDFGKYNDTTVQSGITYNFCAAQNLVLKKLREKSPNAIFYGCIPARTTNYTNGNVPASLYRYAIGSIYQQYGVRIIDLSSAPMLAPNTLGNFEGYITDGLHPTDKYSQILAEYILKKIKNGGENGWAFSSGYAEFPFVQESGGAKFSIYATSDGYVYINGSASVNMSVTPESLVAVSGDLGNAAKMMPPATFMDCLVNEIPAIAYVSSGVLYIRIPKNVTNMTSIFFTSKKVPFKYPLLEDRVNY